MKLPEMIQLSSLGSICQELSIPDFSFQGIADIDNTKASDIVFIFKEKTVDSLVDKDYAFCFIDESSKTPTNNLKNFIKVPNARLLLKRILDALDQKYFLSSVPSKPEISTMSVISPKAKIDPSVHIGPFCQIGDDVVIEKGCVIQSGVQIQKNSHLKEGCYIDNHVTVYANVKLGKNVRIGASSSIGAPGFGFEKKDNKSWEHIPHLSGVIIGDNCFIGCNVCIDGGILKPTELASDVVVDNLVQIAHHVRIGSLTAIAGCVGIAGSAQIGSNCLIGGGACINGHIKITDSTIVTGMTMVTSHITKPGVYSSGIPANANTQWKRNAASFSHLAELRKDISRIKKELLQQ